MNVELRHLRAFAAVADELSFTRAAARLQTSQQVVSVQVRELEERLGARLFDRTTRRVELTAAGAELSARIPALLAKVDAALERARTAGRGEVGSLVVGLLATAPLDFTPRLLRAFAAERPNVSVSVRNATFDDPTGGVRAGAADVALVWLPFTQDGLICEPLFEDERMAVLPADHPLAERTELTVAELLGEPMAWIEDMDAVARDFWTLADQRGDAPPRIGALITGFEDLFAAIRAGQAIALSPASVTRTLPFDDVVSVPVADAPPARVATCRRADSTNPAVEAFVRCARELAARA